MLHYEAILPDTRHVLKKIFELSVKEKFYLAGGTALALQIGHRLSYDLDCFFTEQFNHELLITLLQEANEVVVKSENKTLLFVYVNGIKVDFVYYNSPLLKPHLEVGGLRLFSLEDIAAMKVAATTNRGKKRDFFDLYFLLKKFTLKEILSFYTEKYKVRELMMAVKSLGYFEDAEPDEDPIILTDKVSWEQVKEKLTNELRMFNK